MANQEVVDWRTEWAEAERLTAESSSAEALPYYDRAIATLLRAHGYRVPESGRQVDSDLMQVAEGLDLDALVMYLEAHAILVMIEDGRPAVAETVAMAIRTYRDVHDIFEATAD